MVALRGCIPCLADLDDLPISILLETDGFPLKKGIIPVWNSPGFKFSISGHIRGAEGGVGAMYSI